jgi:hypothetical protein
LIWEVNNLRKKIIGILICTLVIASFIVPITGGAKISSEKKFTEKYGTLNPEANYAFSEKGSNLNNWGITSSVSLAGASEARMEYIQKYLLTPVGGSDKGYVKISDNGGSSWETLWEFQGEADWQSNFFDLNDWIGETVKIAFQYETGDESISQGWSVDKIIIKADGEVKYEEDFEEYDLGDPWGDWIIDSGLNPDNKPPYDPHIEGPNRLKENEVATYEFEALDPDLDPVSYYIEWGDGDITDWTTYYPSGGSKYVENHSWETQGTYKIRVKAKDFSNAESDWTEKQVRITTPRNRQKFNFLIFRHLENLLEMIYKTFPNI